MIDQKIATTEIQNIHTVHCGPSISQNIPGATRNKLISKHYHSNGVKPMPLPTNDKMLRTISYLLLLFILLLMVFAITVSVINDILYYRDTITSAPPFIEAAILAMIGCPFLLASLTFFLVTSIFDDKHHLMEEGPALRKQYHIIKSFSIALFAFSLFIIVIGSFCSKQMGLHSLFFVLLRMQYLSMAYSPTILVSILLMILSWRRLKKAT